jgi:integrase/recombinase XerD
MGYNFVREPLRAEDADRMSNACQTPEEKLVVWTLLDTGLRVGELCNLTPENMMWQQKALSISGKGGHYGKMSKKRIVPLSRRLQALLEPYFAVNDKWFSKKRTAQYMVKAVANKARITVPVTAHILRHTFAVQALDKGISLAAVSRILGHDSILTTQIYLNLTPGHVGEEFHRKW